MGKRYHCEYCEKDFKNDAISIKKHLSSLMHQRARQEYYFQFKDLEILLREETAKQTCGRFRNTGDCQFGVLCRFSHYSPAQLHQMRVQVDGTRPKHPEPSLGDWLQKRSALDQSSATFRSVNSSYSGLKTVWSSPASIKMFPNLPPSLQPVTVEDFKNFVPQAWS